MYNFIIRMHSLDRSRHREVKWRRRSKEEEDPFHLKRICIRDLIRFSSEVEQQQTAVTRPTDATLQLSLLSVRTESTDAHFFFVVECLSFFFYLISSLLSPSQTLLQQQQTMSFSSCFYYFLYNVELWGMSNCGCNDITVVVVVTLFGCKKKKKKNTF